MGTRFIATAESSAVEGYKSMLVESRLDDVALTRGISGIDANFLRPSILACGLDPIELVAPVSPERAREMFSSYGEGMRGPKRWTDLWSAGHTVSAVRSVTSTGALIEEISKEYSLAQRSSARLIATSPGVP
jgi:nitronate monooxygenase